MFSVFRGSVTARLRGLLSDSLSSKIYFGLHIWKHMNTWSQRWQIRFKIKMVIDFDSNGDKFILGQIQFEMNSPFHCKWWDHQTETHKIQCEHQHLFQKATKTNGDNLAAEIRVHEKQPSTFEVALLVTEIVELRRGRICSEMNKETINMHKTVSLNKQVRSE